MKPAYLKGYGYFIAVFKSRHDAEPIEKLVWREYNLDQLTKWRWYFEYRYALLRVKYPRLYINHDTYSYDINPNKYLIHLKNRITARKGKITKYENLLKKGIETWNQLFPIEEDEIYQKCLQKVQWNKNDLAELELQYAEVQKSLNV